MIAVCDAERWVEAASLATPAPVAIVHRTLDRPLRTVRVVAAGEGAAGAIAAELAAAVPARQRHTEGEVAIIAVTEWDRLAQAPMASCWCRTGLSRASRPRWHDPAAFADLAPPRCERGRGTYTSSL